MHDDIVMIKSVSDPQKGVLKRIETVVLGHYGALEKIPAHPRKCCRSEMKVVEVESTGYSRKESDLCRHFCCQKKVRVARWILSPGQVFDR